MYDNKSLGYEDVTRITEEHIVFLLSKDPSMSAAKHRLRISMAHGALSMWTHLVTQLGATDRYEADVERLGALLQERGSGAIPPSGNRA